MDHRVEAVIFDFDYTLVDSSQGIIQCIDQALVELGLPPASPEAVRRTIGLSLPDALLQLVGQEHTAKADAFSRLFIQRADEIMVDHTILLEPVRSTVDWLRSRGIALGIVSIKYRYRIEAVLQREDLLEPFQVIVGGEDVSAHKPDPEGLLKAIDNLGDSRPSTLYVGDSVTDAKTAERAAVPFVAVLSGVTPREAFVDYAVCAILESLSELPGLLG